MSDYNILDFSNPLLVQQAANKYLGNIDVYLSTRKNKKYMIKNPEGKWIHFGLYPFEDFTKHRDEKRRHNFRQRNARWANANKWSASFLAYHLLW
jgi:hypothetical protein